jgi:hypothetical protein
MGFEPEGLPDAYSGRIRPLIPDPFRPPIPVESIR